MNAFGVFMSTNQDEVPEWLTSRFGGVCSLTESILSR